jgi:predicted membrane-bound spermidine synthase
LLRKSWYFIPVLLIEGAALMAVELMGAKLVAPFYGSSLYVWTTVLGITVLGLTLGYYSGGYLSQKFPSEKILFAILGISALLALALPWTSIAAISLSSGMNLVPGIIVASFLFIAPPVFCFGTVGPMVVRLMARKLDTLGKVAGTVYFTSTLGGIIATFLFGFRLIPVNGLRSSAFITGIGLILLPLLYGLVYAFRGKQAKPVQFSNLNDAGIPGIQHEIKHKHKNPGKTTNSIKATAYLFAVLEGATVMAVELMAARMLAPYFGSSLNVWGAVIGITLLSLASGYFLGGRIADKYTHLNTLLWVLFVASLFLMLMHYVSQHLTLLFAGADPMMSVILVSIALIVPSLIFLGMVPTLLIRYISRHVEQSGQITGRVYTISSASGILALPIMGFGIIPAFGLALPSIIIGLSTGIIPFIRLISQKKYITLLFPLIMIFSFANRVPVKSGPDVKVRYYSEGLLGQVLVADVFKAGTGETARRINDRVLFVNRMGQTNIDLTTGNSRWTYLPFTTSAASILPENSKSLLLGLGGGTVANMLHNGLKYEVDAVELDKRIAEVSKKYFSLNREVKVVVDDARHYLETTNKTYDLIFFDVYKGEIPPAHVLSLECFQKAKELLNENGLIIVNFNGFLSNEIGKPGRSVFLTLQAAGFNTKILPTPGTENERNSLFVASVVPRSFNELRSPLLYKGRPVSLDSLFLDTSTLDLNDAVVFVDDRPILEKLNIRASSSWRKDYNENFTRFFSESGVPLFE